MDQVDIEVKTEVAELKETFKVSYTYNGNPDYTMVEYMTEMMGNLTSNKDVDNAR